MSETKLPQTNSSGSIKAGAFTTVNSKQNSEADFGVTVPFAVRIDFRYYSLYKNFTKKQKELLKHLVEASIVALADGKAQLQFNTAQPITINLNANINEVKAEAKAEAKLQIDVNELLQKINSLEALIAQIQKNNFNRQINGYQIPQARFNDLVASLGELKKVVN